MPGRIPSQDPGTPARSKILLGKPQSQKAAARNGDASKQDMSKKQCWCNDQMHAEYSCQNGISWHMTSGEMEDEGIPTHVPRRSAEESNIFREKDHDGDQVIDVETNRNLMVVCCGEGMFHPLNTHGIELASNLLQLQGFRSACHCRRSHIFIEMGMTFDRMQTKMGKCHSCTSSLHLQMQPSASPLFYF